MAKGISPTQRTLQFCRKHGWLVDITEKWIPSLRLNSQGEMELQLFGNRKDLFGFIDLLAVRNGRILAIANHQRQQQFGAGKKDRARMRCGGRRTAAGQRRD